MKKKYYVKIVPFDPVKFDLQYPLHLSGFTTGYLVNHDNKIIKTAWFTNKKDLFKSLSDFLNNLDQ